MTPYEARTESLPTLPDNELLRRLASLVRGARRVESLLVAHIAEVDRRRLYAREACSSMFTYCTRVLHLSEAEAYLRIAVARASRDYPALLDMLADGRLHLRNIAMIAPHLNEENHQSVMARAAHASRRQVEELIAELAPMPDVPTTIRKLPRTQSPPHSTAVPEPNTRQEAQLCHGRVAESRPVAASSELKPARTLQPLAPARYKVQFTASAELRDKLERLTELVRSSDPAADVADAIDAAVSEKLERLEAKRYAKARAPSKSVERTDATASTRYIPAAVKRAVHERDGGRCTFVGENGRRCDERKRLEFHHRKPFARGGGHAPDNVALMCRSHNAYRAECDFGRDRMDRYRSAPSQGRISPA